MRQMKVVEIRGAECGPEGLVVAERERVRAGPGEVVIRVAVAGVNRPDLLQRSGAYPPPPGASDLPGLEVAGWVEEVGPEVGSGRSAEVGLGGAAAAGAGGGAGEVGRRLEVGERVVALCDGGGYAEAVAVKVGQVLRAPRGLGAREAAAIPETFFTVWSMVFMIGRLKAGEVLLVHGASSGIGTTAIQLAKAFGAKVVGTVGQASKVGPCLTLGADAVLVRGPDLGERLEAVLGARRADVVLDVLGGAQVAMNQRLLGVKGRHVQVAYLEGRAADLDLAVLMAREQSFHGARLRPRSAAEKAEIARELLERVWPKIEGGAVRPVISAAFPLAEAWRAHALLESQSHVGKVVLDVAADRW